jgi:hypothetical protein
MQGTTPNWAPLERLAKTEPVNLDDFMWMFTWIDGETTIQAFKHYDTRHYLFLDDNGQAYAWS